MVPSIEIKNLDKKFIGVHALKNVSFTCYPGTVHVLQGENGAGKSTLLKMLTGMYHPDSGEIHIDGKRVRFHHPREAQSYGIAMVYQELSLLPELTVAQNIFLNNIGGRFTNEAKLISEAKKLADRCGIEIDPYAVTGELPIATQQMIEILKALALNPKVLILDEPTSTLTQQEVDKLYSIVQKMKQDNKTILFISHRIEEVFRFGDVATILKDGEHIDTVNVRDVTADDIIQLMVGRKLENIFPPKATEIGETVFEVRDYSDGSKFFDINFSIHRGEILGIGALDGQGQTQLFRSIAGLRSHVSGAVFLNGEQLTYRDVRKAIASGIGYVPEDRKVQALCLGLSCGDNLSMASLWRRQKLGFINTKQETREAAKMVEQLNIKMSSLLQAVVNLSGGNQQKISIGKSLESIPKVLLLNEPTRGIDVEAKQEIYRLMRELVNEGVAILCYTSDMMETIGLCDRVLTMYEGRITDEICGEDITEERIIRGEMNRTAALPDVKEVEQA